MQRLAILGTKVAIAIVFAATLLGQIFLIPAVADQAVYNFPEVAQLRTPAVAWAVVVVICAQVLLLCVWRLLSMVATESIFTESAFRYVNVVIGSCWAAAILIVLGYGGLLATGWLTGPSWVWLATGATISAGVALLVIVMKGLLRKASQLEREMAEVV